MLTDSANLSQKTDKIITCEICDYHSSSKKDYVKHTLTRKHAKNVELTNMTGELTDLSLLHTCSICNKGYKSRVGMWKHSKTCTITPSENMIISFIPPTQVLASSASATLAVGSVKSESEIVALTNLVIEVVKNNSEFQKQMLDMCKNMQSSIMTNCNNTTNNTTFNLQVFLNEYCKDAMNIGEFIDSFDLQISDLESVGRLGYIEGMSNIIINKIKELDVSRRPIHCSDLKREIIYIKDADVWEREDANNTKFRKVIGKVMRKNIGMLSGWRDKYPECMDIESEYNDIYVRLTKEAMGPDDTIDSENKIMKKIVKHIVIDKKAHSTDAGAGAGAGAGAALG